MATALVGAERHDIAHRHKEEARRHVDLLQPTKEPTTKFKRASSDSSGKL